MEKTVYVLGAGFSKPAGAPVQSEIVQEILNLKNKSSGENLNRIKEDLKTFTDFLLNGLYINPKEFKNVAIEDIFTPIDRCILDDISFRIYNNKELIVLREAIYSLIITAINEKLETHNVDKEYINEFGKHLVRQMKPRMQNMKHDIVSVISTNWDILLDNSIKRAIEEDKNNGVVDYCCYISSLEDDPTIKPGLWALGNGKYNVKLLKLHGSMNWLHCPKCQRLFVAFYRKTSESIIDKSAPCKYCETDSSKLRSNLIMPTFLKDLNNFQIKLIWQNASVELMEATKVVFIGYSLREADFELRQLLSRMVSHKAKIEVVMKKEDESTKYRYRSFFGKRKIVFNTEGVKKYINTLTQSFPNSKQLPMSPLSLKKRKIIKK